MNITVYAYVYSAYVNVSTREKKMKKKYNEKKDKKTHTHTRILRTSTCPRARYFDHCRTYTMNKTERINILIGCVHVFARVRDFLFLHGILIIAEHIL